MLQWSSDILDELLAPGISSFDAADIPEVASSFPQAEHWLSNVFLNTAFGPRYKTQWRQAAITFIFRTQTALRAYEEARNTTMECVLYFRDGMPARRRYFAALSHWEVVLLNMQMMMDVFFTFISPNKARDDETSRIWLMANRIKHYAEDISKGVNCSTLTVPIWMEKDALVCRVCRVQFSELAESLREIALAAEVLSCPAPVDSKKSSKTNGEAL